METYSRKIGIKIYLWKILECFIKLKGRTKEAMKTESDILNKFADDIADRLVRKTIAELQKIRSTLSGDGSGLKNAWEEICTQIRIESSYFWEIYDGLAWEIISRHASNLKPHEILAIWFQTDEGEDWKKLPVTSEENYERMGEAEPKYCRVEDISPPICMDEVEHYIQVRLYDKAEDYSNKRIEKFLKRYGEN